MPGVDIEAARWLVYYGAWRVDQGTLDAATAAKVKLVASECAVRASEAAIRIHGGAGIMRDYPVGRIHRDSLVYVIGEGTSEIQRNLIARGLGLSDSFFDVAFAHGDPAPRLDKNGKVHGWDVPTGRKILPTMCGYCAYKGLCWPGAELDVDSGKPKWVLKN